MNKYLVVLFNEIKPFIYHTVALDVEGAVHNAFNALDKLQFETTGFSNSQHISKCLKKSSLDIVDWSFNAISLMGVFEDKLVESSNKYTVLIDNENQPLMYYVEAKNNHEAIQIAFKRLDKAIEKERKYSPIAQLKKTRNKKEITISDWEYLGISHAYVFSGWRQNLIQEGWYPKHEDIENDLHKDINHVQAVSS